MLSDRHWSWLLLVFVIARSDSGWVGTHVGSDRAGAGVVALVKPAWCRNCAARLAWHTVGQCLVHDESGHQWCFEDQQGYDQPRATA